MGNGMETALTWLHVSGNIVWIGAILAVGAVMTSQLSDSKTRGALALQIYKSLAVPAFVVSFGFGAVRLFMDTSYYLKEHHWMHGKLGLAVGVIAIHHVLGGRAKRMAAGTVTTAGPTGALTVALGVLAVLATFSAVMKLPR
jgi:putative membrane protein